MTQAYFIDMGFWCRIGNMVLKASSRYEVSLVTGVFPSEPDS